MTNKKNDMQGSVNTNAAGLMSRREPPKITKIKRQLKSNKKKEKDDISVVKWKDNKERNETGVAGWEEGWGFYRGTGVQSSPEI